MELIKLYCPSNQGFGSGGWFYSDLDSTFEKKRDLKHYGFHQKTLKNYRNSGLYRMISTKYQGMLTFSGQTDYGRPSLKPFSQVILFAQEVLSIFI